MAVIVADHRERGSLAARKLEELARVEWRQLETCDYIAGGVCVERKTAEDYVASLADGRLEKQLYAMSSSFTCSVLLVEGYVDEALLYRKMKRHAVIASLASAVAKQGHGHVSIITLSTPFDTALFIYYLAEKAGEPRLPPRINRKNAKLSLLQALPGIGKQKAKLLLERFGSVRGVANASVEELASVKGISVEMAKRIHELLT